jgi:hypothetical protein
MKNPKPVTLTLSDQQIVLMARAGVQAMFDMVVRGEQIPAQLSVTLQSDSLPEIGAQWNGGICAGPSIHDNKPVGLVLLPGEIEAATWGAASEWAKKQGGELPSRIDQLVLLKNLKREFKEAYYWSGEEHAGDSAYAWSQDFGTGGQFCWHKDYKYHSLIHSFHGAPQ